MVEVAWTHHHHDNDELDFAKEEGDMTLDRALGTRVVDIYYTQKNQREIICKCMDIGEHFT
jgi:hypothetical protein